MEKIKIAEYAITLLEKMHKDSILLNRMLYKTKNQFRRQKQYQLLQQLKKIFQKIFFYNNLNITNKTPNIIASDMINMKLLSEEKINEIIDLILKIGGQITEMLKLKLYSSYSIIILGITRYIIFNIVGLMP